MPKYQAIIFDLDGTAIPNRPDGQPSSRLVDTVARHQHRIKLVAATGRPLTIAMPIISALGLTNPCIVAGGTIIVDPSTASVLKITHLPAAAIHAIYDVIKHQPYALFLREDRINLNIDAIHPAVAENVEILFIGLVPPADVPELTRAFAKIPGISASVVPDWSGQEYFAFNITHIDATKEHAVTDILSRIGVPSDRAIGVGDAGNDLHLFRSVGLKVAMGNASPELKAAADIIAPSVSEDGLAQIIDQFATQ